MSIVVIGSLNMDKVCVLDRLPALGETLKAVEFFESYGGKGANQAVAAARLGSRVTMLGCVGKDQDGDRILQNMADNGVDVSKVKVLTNSVTGKAMVSLTQGDNAIVVASGANDQVTIDYIVENENTILGADWVLIQNEIPMATVAFVLENYGNSCKIIYNPAPYQLISLEAVFKATWITPNASEAKLLHKQAVLLDKSTNFITTLGSAGVEFYQNGIKDHIPAAEVTVKDSTGAGDTFNGALAHFLSENVSLKEAVFLANTAAGLSTEVVGAQSGMPTQEQVFKRSYRNTE